MSDPNVADAIEHFQTLFGDSSQSGSSPTMSPDPTQQTIGGTADRPGGPSRAAIADKYPWMPGELIDVFIETLDETGSTKDAVGAVRDHSAYDNHFPGNRRGDGTFRFSEAGYVAQERAILTTLDRLELSVADEETLIRSAFESELKGSQFARAITQTAEQFRQPGRGVPSDLLTEYAENLSQTGSPQQALSRTRDSSTHQGMFPGLARDDGTLRMTEQEYFQTKQSYRQSLASRNLNPSAYESRLNDLIAGEVSAREFEGRIRGVEDNIIDNIDEAQQFYADNYGLNLNREAILASAMDPETNRALLERRISASQIGGEALRADFERSQARAEELARAGVDQQQARRLYNRGQRQVPQMQVLIDRYNDPGDPFDIEDFEEAVVFGDPDVRRRMERRRAEERSQFSTQQGQVATEEGRLTGLRRR